MHYQTLKLDKMYKYALFYLQGMVYRHAQNISLARTTEKLSNIKSNYTQNRLKCGETWIKHGEKSKECQRSSHVQRSDSKGLENFIFKQLSGQLPTRSISGLLSSINMGISGWFLRFTKKLRNLPAALGNDI